MPKHGGRRLKPELRDLFTKPIDFPELRGEIGRRLEGGASHS